MSRFTHEQQLELYRDCVQALDEVKGQMVTAEFLLQTEYDDFLVNKFQTLHNLKRRMNERLEGRIREYSPNLLEEVIDIPSVEEPESIEEEPKPSDSKLKPIAEIIDVE